VASAEVAASAALKVTYILVGAGGHARAVVEAAAENLGAITAYVDPRPAKWLAAKHLTADSEIDAADLPVVIGVGGVTTAQLAKRLVLLDAYLNRGHYLPPIVHPTAHVSPSAQLEAGAIVLAGAFVQPGVIIGRGTIVNTRAIIEHDSMIEAGTHVAPGAVILGGCRVGRCVMVGANAVVLPGTVVADETLVPALTRYGCGA
jgi:sugar O-acyltransferase (sialic acid O-acetyltransferase NeuD family)